MSQTDLSKSVSICDEKADKAIAAMVAGIAAAAVIPAQFNWALVAGAIGAGVVAIGACYGRTLSKEEGWDLAKTFFLSAGAMYIGIELGSKVIAAIMSMTVIGHAAAVALDATVSGAAAFAVGKVGKEYFRRDYLGKARPSKAEMGQLFRDAFKRKKAERA